MRQYKHCAGSSSTCGSSTGSEARQGSSSDLHDVKAAEQVAAAGSMVQAAPSAAAVVGVSSDGQLDTSTADLQIGNWTLLYRSR
jgi:hypothetical protein